MSIAFFNLPLVKVPSPIIELSFSTSPSKNILASSCLYILDLNSLDLNIDLSVLILLFINPNLTLLAGLNLVLAKSALAPLTPPLSDFLLLDEFLLSFPLPLLGYLTVVSTILFFVVLLLIAEVLPFALGTVVVPFVPAPPVEVSSSVVVVVVVGVVVVLLSII